MKNKIIYFYFLLFYFTTPVLLSQISNEQINSFISNWKNYWETKDIYKIDYLLTSDYEYYDINSEKRNKTERLKYIKNLFKENGNINYEFGKITYDKKSSNSNDVKIVFEEIVKGANLSDSSIVTLRLFKGKETKNNWKIYREIHDISDISRINETKSSQSIIDNCYFVFIFLVVMAIALAILTSYVKTKCPKCEKGFSRKWVNKKLIESEDGYATVNRRDRVENPNDFNDIHYIDKFVQVHIRRDYYLITWKCKSCGHTWETVEVQKYEG